MTAPTRFRFFLSLSVAVGLAILAGFSGPGAGTEGTKAVVMNALIPASWNAEVPTPWTAVATSGTVEVLPARAPTEAWAPVGRGDTLEPQSLVRTGNRGRAALARWGDIILIDPDGALVLPTGTGATTRIEHRSGSVVYDVARRPLDRFEVVTPYLVARVRGTIFSVIVEDDLVAVTVAEGQVEITSSSGGQADLFPGDMVLMESPKEALEIFRNGFDEFALPGSEADEVAQRLRRRADRLIARAARDDPRNEHPGRHWARTGSAKDLGLVDPEDDARWVGRNER